MVPCPIRNLGVTDQKKMQAIAWGVDQIPRIPDDDIILLMRQVEPEPIHEPTYVRRKSVRTYQRLLDRSLSLRFTFTTFLDA